jgi:hypothetical protein
MIGISKISPITGKSDIDEDQEVKGIVRPNLGSLLLFLLLLFTFYKIQAARSFFLQMYPSAPFL